HQPQRGDADRVLDHLRGPGSPRIAGADRRRFVRRVAMTVARDLAEFFARLDYADLPAQATDHAAMLIASTFANAACGRDIASSVVIRDMARERGGNPQASLWFDAGPKLP